METEELLAKIKQQTLSFSPKAKSLPQESSPFSKIEAPKPSFSEITPYKEETIYKTLGSGERVAMFENFIPGTDNQERLAQQQTTGEKWANGVAKFGKKTLNAVVGGTAGIVYGVGEAISDGNMSSIYDNDFSNWLSDLDTKMNYQLPNYYSKQEQEKGLLGQIGTANFWSDKFLGGVSFTAGALISEGIWGFATGGTSLATTGARWGTKLTRLGKWGAKSADEVVDVVDAMAKTKGIMREIPGQTFRAIPISKTLPNAMGKTGELASLATFMGRSAGYEASVEALQFKKEAEENFYANFKDLNGREPDSEDIAEFNKNLKSQADTVFGLNMAIVGSSNLVTMGHILDIKNPIKTGLTDFVEKKAFGYGLTKTATGTLEKATATTGQKVFRNVFNYGVKPGFTEGLFEEGGQGVTNKYSNKWIEHTYNPQHTNDNFDSAGAFYESLGEQYGTKEGWVENGLGILIGMFGGSVNTRSEMKAQDEMLDYKASVANVFNENMVQKTVMPIKLQTANRIEGFSQSAKENEAKGNVVFTKLDQDSAKIAFINSNLVLGESINDMTAKMQKGMETITPQQWKEAGVETENIEEYKQQQLNEFKTLAKQYKANKTYWQYMLGRKMVGEQNINETALEGVFGRFSKNASVVEALAWQSTVGEKASSLMEDTRVALGREVGEENAKVLRTINQLQESKITNKEELKTLQKTNKALEKQREKLKLDIVKAQELQGTDTQKIKYSTLASQLLKVEESLINNRNRAEEIAENLNQNTAQTEGLSEAELDILSTSFTGETISADDILSLDDTIKKLNDIVESSREVNPRKYQYIQDLMKEYADAKSVFMQSQTTQRFINSKDFKIQNISSWLGGKVYGSKAMDKTNQEWLEESLNTYAQAKTKGMSLLSQEEQTQQETITDEQYKDFIDNGNVDENTLLKIAEKVKNQTPLTDRENAIFVDKTSEVNNIIKDNTTTKPKVEEQTAPQKPLKQQIEDLLKSLYKDLSNIGQNFEDISAKKPTQQEIEDYKKGERNPELVQKMNDWKLINTAVSEDFISIGEMVDLINQWETQIETEQTKDEVTVSEAFEELKEDDSVGDGQSFKPELLIDPTVPVTIKKNAKKKTIEITHVKPQTIVDRLGGDSKTKGNKKLENLEKDDWFEVGNIKFGILASGRISVSQDKFDNTLQEALNLNLIETDVVNWSFKDSYSELSDGTFVKTPSDFKDNLNTNKAFDLKKGDRLSLHIDSTDNWNAIKGDNEQQLKIYLKDKNGNNIQILRADNSSETDVVNPNFLEMRRVAYERWTKEGKPQTLDLGMSVEFDGIFLGSPQFNIVDKKLTDLNIPQEVLNKIVISKGYIQNGEVTLDRVVNDVDLTYTKRLSMKDGGMKRPIIVFKRGNYNIAFPVSLTKTPQPIDFDDVFSKGLNDREIILEINNRIIQNGIETEKLLYSDINNQEKIEATRQAFANKTTFVSADRFASDNYALENLTRDATIKIDLSDIEKTIASPKVRINLNSLEVTTTKDLKNNSLVEVENRLNDLALELYKDYVQNASTKYLDNKGDIIEDTVYTNTLDDNEIISTDSQLKKIGNINILKEAFSQKLPKSLATIIGADKINEVNTLLKRYDYIKSQIAISDMDKKSGEKNSECIA